MPIVTFLGVILPGPGVVNVSLPDLPVINFQESTGLKMQMMITVKDCRVIVACELSRYVKEDFSYLYIRATDIAKAAVDIVTFASGEPLLVYLHTIINPDGEATPIHIHEPRVAELCTAYKLENMTGEDIAAMQVTMLHIFQEPNLFIAMNDLTQTIAVPHCAAVKCRRVIDAIRKLIAPGMERGAAWEFMQNCLQVDKPYTEWISQQSVEASHGPTDDSFPKEISAEIMQRTWTMLMNRF